ncbi:membrane-associated phospholipid phosphatase [Pelomonas saccharophila]|uniref:Membrane-associated phospholipid phosphatase n=1 Tax=Roseateles saccharophilus TaxID=304 RepID=A0ABU1YKY2_ROSSA|nr:phosphatase PAP2 family protein [Roseateles saccharophilus]MDR7269383.1 membrane-associated phospholipid phosphatase [Roseateles saccharophilus]
MGAAPATGAGGSSGAGFMGGYGPVARFEYATPAALSPLPWVMDFAQGDGWSPFPFEQRINPYDPRFGKALEWENSDWDLALRFWTLDFDPQLTEWLQDVNLAAPSVMAAREFATAHEKWLAGPARSTLQKKFEANENLLKWRALNGRGNAWAAISRELDELADLMRDDRMRYVEELAVQSSQAAPYFVHLMNFNPATKPWTMELMNCAAAMGNLVKMQYKSHYKRVRPSTLCPGLTPPWGPAQHPAFPSGHSTVAHLTALLLLSVEGIADRFGLFEKENKAVRGPNIVDFDVPYGQDQRSPLLWLAWRIARGRERLGVHYPSDSAAGRYLAAHVWDMCLNHTAGTADAINVPALQTVLTRARAEWPRLVNPAEAERLAKADQRVTAQAVAAAKATAAKKTTPAKRPAAVTTAVAAKKKTAATKKVAAAKRA